MTPDARARVRRRVFAGAVALCLVRPAIALFVELPRTPRHFRPEYLDAIRAQAPDGNVLLAFALPAGAEEVAAAIYYECTYDLYPRRVLVTDEPVVINDGRDLLRVHPPDPGWLAAHGVKWRVVVVEEAGRLRLAVQPVQPP